MASSSPIAKVTRPVPAGFFPRKRLYRLLDRSRKSPLLWITGPPGCGKTTLVSSYIESRRLPCLWYKVDEADADLSAFFYYLGLAARKAAPRRKRILPLLTPDRLPGLTVFAQRYFEDLSALLPAPCLLVLDDCHRLPDDSPFFGTLREGISRLAPGIVSVLVSRHDPHPSFARERANRLLEVVGWEELRLTLAETAGIVRSRRRRGLPPGRVRDLHEQTDGWAAGLVLLLERRDREQVEPRTIGKQVPSEIIDYFGSEVFRRQGEEMRGFLLQSAFLPRMTASMAERLTGVGRADRILSEMNRHNLFTKKYLRREPVYEYHDLFREFLLRHAEDTFSGEELAGIRTAAAALLEEAGYVEDAAGLFRQAGDLGSLARLILSRAEFLVAQGRYQTLLEWLQALPGEIVENEPWLLYWKGIALNPFSIGGGRTLFEEAFRKFEARKDAAGSFLSWSGVVNSISSASDSWLPIGKWISLFPDLFERYHGFPTKEIGDWVTCTLFGALVYVRPPGIDIEAWAERTLAVARTNPRGSVKITARVPFFLYKLGRGGFQDAEQSIVFMREALKQPDVAPSMRIWVDWVETSLSAFVSRFERGLKVASDGLAFTEKIGVHGSDSLLAAYCALHALHLRDGQTASRYLERMKTDLAETRPVFASFHHLVFACDELRKGEIRKAAFHVEEGLRILEDARNPSYHPLSHVFAAHVHHRLGEGEKAAWNILEARRIGSEIESPHAFWLSDLTEASFALDRKDDASAIAALKKGLQTGREHGLFGTFFWLPGFLERVAARALEEGIEVDYIKELIRRNRLLPEPSDPALERWPWPVKVCTLGRFELLVEDRPVEFGRKVPQRPLSLLKVLISLGGKEITEARISELLWPDADGDMAHQAFTSALKRLRKLLVDEDALLLKEGRLTLSNRHCWVDVWAFERYLAMAEQARKEGNRKEAARLFDKSLSLYRGSFLPFEEASWAASLREKLRTRFLESVTRLGRSLEDAGRWMEAIACYGRGLEADELAEELYRRLMVCHLRQGQEAEALSVYRRCRKTLSSVLGVNPSEKTRAIAESIGRSLV